MNETLDTGLEFTTTRMFDAPRELVFQAWTDPGIMRQWAAPRGFTITYQAGEVRPGGVWRVCMRSPDGVDLWLGGSYAEIAPPQRLVFTHVWDEESGQPVHETLVTVTFEDLGGKTLLTLHQQAFKSRASRDGHEAGWNEGLDILAELLAKPGARHSIPQPRRQSMSANNSEFVISRVFDAPLDLVWKAWTEAERLAQWWGPKGFAMLSARLDLRPGGVFHYGMRSPNGQEMWGKFVYREIVPFERIVFVVSFSDEHEGVTRHPWSAGWPLEVLNTLTFDVHEGRTTLTLRGSPINATDEECQTFEAGRDGMRQGFGGTLDQLAAYLDAVLKEGQIK